MDTSSLYALCLSLVFLFFTFKFIFRSRKQLHLPPSPLSLPIIGHLLHMKQPLHRTFSSLSKKYGPIFSLKVGSRNMVVVSSPSLVQQCLNTNDKIFANRPIFLNTKHFGYNNTTIDSAPYGEHFRNLRKIASLEVLSSQRIISFTHIRRDEVQRLIIEMSGAKNIYTKVDLKRMVSKVLLNQTMWMIAGKRYFDSSDDVSKIEESVKFHGIIQSVLDKSGAGNLVDYFPLVKWIDPNYVDVLKGIAAKMDDYLQGLVDDHRQKKGDTMIDHLLFLQASEPEKYSDQIIKGLAQAMLLGGTDTSIATTTWAMSNLLNNPHVLEKARSEIDTHVGHGRLINESDLPNLHYLQNIISETLRLFPPVPFLIPHCSSKECIIGGYRIPKDTILLVNTWAINRDCEISDEPACFDPERFENEYAGKTDPYKLIPFGVGRRSCPGQALALRFVGLILGSLIQCFDWKRVGEDKLDMTEGTGVVMQRVNGLEVMCKARPFLKHVLVSKNQC